jgi:hypothetical protein
MFAIEVSSWFCLELFGYGVEAYSTGPEFSYRQAKALRSGVMVRLFVPASAGRQPHAAAKYPSLETERLSSSSCRSKSMASQREVKSLAVL